jgi:hypothetical protein
MSAIVWSNGLDSPVQAIFSGINARQLWQGENGAQAVIVKIEPGARGKVLTSTKIVRRKFW